MVHISIIIVTLNAEKFIRLCLDSVFAQQYKDFEVIIIDNGSTDSTVKIIADNYPQVKLIQNKANLGFCKANNMGIKQTKGEAILTLNSDVVLEKDFLSNLMQAYQKADKKTGMFACKILSWDKKKIDSTGIILTKTRRFFDRSHGRNINNEENKDILGPCAAAALYKREMLEDISYAGQYFDEDFFFLVEDFDITWRAKRRRWKVAYVSRAICCHYRNSTNFNVNYRQYLSFRNRYYLIIKNESVCGILKFIPFFFFYDIPRLIYMLITNRHALKALKEVISNAFLMLNKSNKLMCDNENIVCI